MHFYKVLWIVALAVALLAPGSKSRAEILLFQDSFNDEDPSWPLNYDQFQHWNVTGGSVDLHGAGTAFDYLPGNGLYIDLDGTTGEAGQLETKQMFGVGPGHYLLSFELAGSQRGDTNTVHVRLGSVYAEQITLESDVPFTLFERLFHVPVPVSARLIFAHDGGDNSGLLLNNVRLAQVTDPAVIPVPAALPAAGVLLAGLAGTGAICRRRGIRVV